GPQPSTKGSSGLLRGAFGSASRLLDQDLELPVVLHAGREGEVRDRRLPSEGESARDLDLVTLELEHVVAGFRVAAHAERRDGPRIAQVDVLEAPDVRHVLVPGQHDVDARVDEDL